jgi:hypothetical protein
LIGIPTLAVGSDAWLKAGTATEDKRHRPDQKKHKGRNCFVSHLANRVNNIFLPPQKITRDVI